MKPLRDLHDKAEPLFEKGGPLEKLYPLWEAHDTAMFTPGSVTRTAPHVRDGILARRAANEELISQAWISAESYKNETTGAGSPSEVSA